MPAFTGSLYDFTDACLVNAGESRRRCLVKQPKMPDRIRNLPYPQIYKPLLQLSFKRNSRRQDWFFFPSHSCPKTFKLIFLFKLSLHYSACYVQLNIFSLRFEYPNSATAIDIVHFLNRKQYIRIKFKIVGGFCISDPNNSLAVKNFEH